MPATEVRDIQNVVIGVNYPSGEIVTRCASVSGRRRSWERSSNFRSTPRRDLGVNAYLDERWRVDQIRMVEAVSHLGGVLDSRTFDGRQWGGLEAFIIDYAALASAEMRSESSQINETALSCLNKIGDAKVNLPVAVAEGKKTSQLILERANRIYRAYRSLRRGNFSDVASQLNISPRRVHKTWLEYKYGWMPLLMDVKGSAEFFAQQHFPRPPYFKAVGFTRDFVSGSLGSSTEGWDQLSRSITYTRECKVGQDVQAVSPVLHQTQQLGLTNPLLVAWELVPYGFVFDWFIHVGDYLQGLTALNGLEILRGYQSFVKQITVTRSATQNPSTSGGYTNSGYGSEVKVFYRAYQRVPYIVSIGNLYPPAAKSDSFGFQKMITSLALLRSNSR